MGGCSSHSGVEGQGTWAAQKDGPGMEELVKACSIEEANQLIKEGHSLMAVYWNCANSREEYILGRQKKEKAPHRKMGFSL